jgi:hypothetical protein
VVHRDHGRHVRRRRERLLEPAEPPVVELTAVLARDRRVDDDEPQRAQVDGVLHRLPARSRNAEVPVQCVTVVVVAGQDVGGRVDLPQQCADLLVLVVGRVVGQVPRDEHRVRARSEGAHGVDRSL